MAVKVIPIKTIPFVGGIDLNHEPVALPNGGISEEKNLRPRRPGKESRLGQAKHHTTTAYSAKDIVSAYGFSKSRLTENHLFAQYSDGSVDIATDNPPTVTTGDFGTSALSARTNPWPASWAKFEDMLVYADGSSTSGAGMAQIYTGQNMKPVFFNVYRGVALTIPDIPEEGADYTQEVTDGLGSTTADLSSLGIFTDEDALFIGFDTPINKLTFTVVDTNNWITTAAVAYRKDDSTWANVSGFSDGTSAASKSLAQSGDMVWTAPTDEIPHYSFGRSCFIYRIVFDNVGLDAAVSLSAITGEYTGGFQPIQNVWDGIMPDATVALVNDTSAGTFATYSSQAILCGDLAAADFIYISSPDRLFGLYLDVGGTPNTTPTTVINGVATWTGEAFTALSTLNDGSNGGANTAFVTWQRNDNIRKLNFNGTVEHAYWYKISFDKALTSSLSWAIAVLPYFEIDEIFPIVQAVASWDNRLWYCFNDNQLHGTDIRKPMSLNGDNYVLIEAAKHSKNKVICMRRFYQYLLTWGEEKGEDGGFFSIIQPGATAAGYDSQVVSERIGIVNNKCAVIIEDAKMQDLNTLTPVRKGVYFLSKEGVFKSDGATLINLSGGIQNYFDPTRSEVIRRGYEKEHFLAWDSAYRILRLGLVSGGSAIVPNVFFTFDPSNDTWHQDVLGQPLSCMIEVDGASGDLPVLQYGGGQDGFMYRLNTTDDDVSIAIDKSIKIELDGEGHKLMLREMVVIMKDQTAGDLIVDIFRKGETAAAFTKTLAMQNASSDYKGHRFKCESVTGDHLTVRFRNNTISQPVNLLKYGFDIVRSENGVVYD